MNEEYLHFIWSRKRIVASEIKSKNHELIRIIKPGLHNTILAGPDFSHAQIIINDIEWHGPVELHVKSSDWYKHKHQKDKSYDNVILHVVYEHDKEIIQNGRTLPTLELKDFIDWDHYEQFERFRSSRNEIACAGLLLQTDRFFLESMMTKSIMQKWDEKIKVIQEYIQDPNDAMITFLGAAFGGHLNMHPFLQTIAVLPADKLRRMSPIKRYSTLLAHSGIVHEKTNNGGRWHFKGNRPGNYPSKRLYQFAHYMFDEQLKMLASLASANEVIIHFDEIMKTTEYDLKLSKNFKNHILINAIVPFFNYTAHITGEERFQEFAIEILQLIPAESNNITRKWESIGLKPKNAWESQGVLALHRYYCKAKKCLSCEVGNAIIRKA